MKETKPETLSTENRRRQLMQWLSITGGVMTPGGMIPTTVFYQSSGNPNGLHAPSRRPFSFGRVKEQKI